MFLTDSHLGTLVCHILFYIPWKELSIHKEQQHLSDEESLSTPLPQLGVELLWQRHGTTLRKGFLMDKSCFSVHFQLRRQHQPGWQHLSALRSF